MSKRTAASGTATDSPPRVHLSLTKLSLPSSQNHLPRGIVGTTNNAAFPVDLSDPPQRENRSRSIMRPIYSALTLFALTSALLSAQTPAT